jgi:sporulation protein YlmC with PRC-barrel domain
MFERKWCVTRFHGQSGNAHSTARNAAECALRRRRQRGQYGGSMSESDAHPIAYTALQPGTPVQTNDGHHFASVQAVLVDEKVSVFDGIVVETAEGTRFVDADQIGSIYTTYVRTSLSTEQASNLPLPDGSTLIDIKPAGSMAGRLGRIFGRGKR